MFENSALSTPMSLVIIRINSNGYKLTVFPLGLMMWPAWTYLGCCYKISRVF